MTGLPAPTFRSSQPLRVRVSHDGRVEALQTGTGILVIAELAVEGNVRQVDTARITVTANAAPPVLASFELDPVPGDSAVWTLGPSLQTFLAIFLLNAGIDVFPRLAVHAFDAAGNAITDLLVDYRSLDPSVAVWNISGGGFVDVFRLGQARMVASTSAYGVVKADTVTFTVKLPLYQSVDLHSATRTAGALDPSGELKLRPGGWVLWRNLSGQPADVTFDDPTNVVAPTRVCDAVETIFAMQIERVYGGPFPCGAGSISAFNDVDVAFGNDNTVNFRIRQFPVPGVYTYRNTVTGAIGRIVVTDG